MSDFDQEMNRGLDGLVRKTNYRDWTNPVDPTDDKLRDEFRAAPLRQGEVKDSVSESVDGLPVKDRDIVEGEVQRRVIGGNLKEEDSVVEENSEVVRGSLHTEGSDDDVPEGTVRKVTEWVGDDKDRAQRALEEEQAKENPRKSLIEKLEEVIGE